MKKYDFTQLRNIGKKTAHNLESMGIKDLDEMRRIGTEELFFKYFQYKGGWNSGMCSCWLYVIEGALTDTNWWKIPNKKKEKFKKYVKDLRNSFKPQKKC